MSTEQEVERLQQVYRGYREQGLGQTQWAESNPGNAAIACARDARLRAALEASGFFPLAGKRILDVGCGGGGILSGCQNWGARPENLFGVDLMASRVEDARRDHPGMHFQTANAEQLPFQSGYFDLVLLYTVFTSVLDDRMAANMAAEVARVLKPGGAVVWYDFRFNNPRNSNVRGLGHDAIARLFPGFTLKLSTVTLLPPLARRMGPLTGVLYPMLVALPFLRTHYAGLLCKAEADSTPRP